MYNMWGDAGGGDGILSNDDVCARTHTQNDDAPNNKWPTGKIPRSVKQK